MTSETPRNPSILLPARVRPSTNAPSSSAHATSPHTPLSRSISASLYGSPSSFRVDDENLLIFEIGSRYIRAGFAGESSPRCIQSHSPEKLRRVADYRQYALGYDPRKRRRRKTQEWSWGYELWHPDIRDQDLSYLGDRLERIIREIESTELMLDSRTKKVTLVLSAQLPRPLMEITVSKLFNTLQCPTITVLPSNTMSIIGAGLRSALVIDIGWSETNISGIYEYRQIAQKTTTRAAKLLIEEYVSLITNDITVEEAEDVLIRQGWCRSKILDASQSEIQVVNIELGSTSVHIPFQDLADPVDRVLFGLDTEEDQHDDDENIPLHILAYLTLLQLPLDVRKTCVSRIVVTGGASNIPGLKRRILEELNDLIDRRQWNITRKYPFSPSKLKAVSKTEAAKAAGSEVNVRNDKAQENEKSESTTVNTPAHLLPIEPDRILAKIKQHQRTKNEVDPFEVTPRIINTLGPWVGASLATSLRIRGVVEIERDRFMSVGLMGGATATGGVVASATSMFTTAATTVPNAAGIGITSSTVAGQRHSLGQGGGAGTGTGRQHVEKSSWSLGVWA